MNECYNFVLKGLIDQVILYSQMCIRCNITALLFLRVLNVGAGLISMEFQYKYNTPTLKERLLLEFRTFVFFSYKTLNNEEHIENKQ